MPLRPSRARSGSLALCCLLGVACTDEGPGQDNVVAPDPGCGASAEMSFWARGAPQYQRLASYGAEPGGELFDVWGVGASSSGRVVVWDAGQTRVLVLSPDLEVLRSMGGEGEGPGEFVYQKVPHGNWLTLSDSTVTVVGLSNGVFAEFGRPEPEAPRPSICYPFQCNLRAQIGCDVQAMPEQIDP